MGVCRRARLKRSKGSCSLCFKSCQSNSLERRGHSDSHTHCIDSSRSLPINPFIFIVADHHLCVMSLQERLLVRHHDADVLLVLEDLAHTRTRLCQPSAGPVKTSSFRETARARRGKKDGALELTAIKSSTEFAQTFTPPSYSATGRPCAARASVTCLLMWNWALDVRYPSPTLQSMHARETR